ncbi:hypothetical protein SKAU_G00235570 [Synaphobranchus kaupii]|uniref:Uncharacterized protein n=1 Tax=Synaphobranchus kaupii TaxID=118154 RepID=A0A9Q1F6J3_SYNKA|nr:hypothetical protein SKAU_G00235570 [Synaphobranchus kaupii]
MERELLQSSLTPVKLRVEIWREYVLDCVTAREEEGEVTMSDSERKSLVCAIRKSLLTLPMEELFQIFPKLWVQCQGCELYQEAKPPGKREPVTAWGHPVTGSQKESQPKGAQRTGPNAEPCSRISTPPHLGPGVASMQSRHKQVKTPTLSSPDSPADKTGLIARLIKALTQCYLNGLAVSVLLDTGAQVSMVGHDWKAKYLPDLDIRSLREIISDEGYLEVHAVNGDLIPFNSWVAITVNIPGNEDPNLSINVPFLVCSLPLERLLLGFNVLEELIQGQPEQLMPTLFTLLFGAIPIPTDKANAIVRSVQTMRPSVQQGRLRVGHQRVVILAG